jgi:hypothetical protein
MHLKAIDQKIEAEAYQHPEDFEYDVSLIFKNCEAYNLPKRNDHIIILSKCCAKAFRKLYSSRIKSYDSSGGKNLFGDTKREKKRSPPTIVPTELPPAKKLKKEAPGGKAMRKSPVLVPTIKAPVPITHSTSVRGKSPKLPAQRPRIQVRRDAPVPLHVAIQRIKECFPSRRAPKDLNDWDAACYRFFRELKRHPWISAARPKFIFHVPVPILHPEIKDAYALKIRNPMDLTTAECKLLQGGIYNNCQEFIDDVSLVFANAVTFNQTGQEQGDPTSCAYYDASRHLLRYTRWLSLEILSSFLLDDSHNEGAKQIGPLPGWKLTTSNRSDAKFEMENMVLKQLIEKSEEGDRYTWMEAEGEKLQKSLRHQTDLKHMTFFLQPNYPPDYYAYISKPMDWESCQRGLQQRKYETFGQIVEDLRLIFSNALKYNGRLKDSDPVSKQAYDSAVFMSGKLEAAILRMLLTVSDRIEREKIDQIILDRENEVAARSEEQRLRTEWKKDRERSCTQGEEIGPTATLPAIRKPVQRRPPQQPNMDFDFPFYDEEPTHERTEMEALNQQKMTYEKQQEDRINMHSITRAIGCRVYANLLERSRAIDWSKQLSEQININLASQVNKKPSAAMNIKLAGSGNQEVQKDSQIKVKKQVERAPIKLSFIQKKNQNKKKAKKIAPKLVLE